MRTTDSRIKCNHRSVVRAQFSAQIISMTQPINRFLINHPEGARRLETPALILDKTTFLENAQRMQRLCDEQQFSFRPHAKTHKSVEVAKIQIELGASGICCAKIGEAEALSIGGIESILITSPIVTEPGIRRAISLSRTTNEIVVVIDNPAIAALTNQLANTAGVEMDVLVDIDPGMHRTGIPLGSQSTGLVREVIEDYSNLNFRGVQYYAGNLMHIFDYIERRNRYLELTEKLKNWLDSLNEFGFDCDLISGGGTGSYEFDFQSRVMNDLQAGSYAFMDRQYLDVRNSQGDSIEFKPSLFVQSTIVSSNHSQLATTDAGLKSYATDADVPEISFGAPIGSTYGFMGDEHGFVRWPDLKDSMKVGEVVRTIVPHCDPTINLYDYIHVLENETLIDIWRIDARGRSY